MKLSSRQRLVIGLDVAGGSPGSSEPRDAGVLLIASLSDTGVLCLLSSSTLRSSRRGFSTRSLLRYARRVQTRSGLIVGKIFAPS
jgi:hypothetical protein